MHAMTTLRSPTTGETRAHIRSDYGRLRHRYVQLTWATSAMEQRERAGLEEELLTLYLTLHPNSHAQVDDFDTILRMSPALND